MTTKLMYSFLLLTGIAVINSSCGSTKKFVTTYYYQHEQALNKIEENYKRFYAQKAFNIVFTDKAFSILTLELKTDSLTYIYQFDVDEPRMIDTLKKYHKSAAGISNLIRQMQSIHCIWINNLDYYVDEQKKSMVFISIKPMASRSHFAYKKYCILSYFNQPQYFDNEGRLLVKRKLRKIHTINGDIFRRINDKICYTVSGRYR
ncbi:MAG: hypothetical protein ABIN01_24800 [Ferruginibacter sp.]